MKAVIAFRSVGIRMFRGDVIRLSSNRGEECTRTMLAFAQLPYQLKECSNNNIFRLCLLILYSPSIHSDHSYQNFDATNLCSSLRCAMHMPKPILAYRQYISEEFIECFLRYDLVDIPDKFCISTSAFTTFPPRSSAACQRPSKPSAARSSHSLKLSTTTIRCAHVTFLSWGGLKGVVFARTSEEVSLCEEGKKTVKEALEERYARGKNR
jgi:hypothetical protein